MYSFLLLPTPQQHSTTTAIYLMCNAGPNSVIVICATISFLLLCLCFVILTKSFLGKKNEAHNAENTHPMPWWGYGQLGWQTTLCTMWAQTMLFICATVSFFFLFLCFVIWTKSFLGKKKEVHNTKNMHPTPLGLQTTRMTNNNWEGWRWQMMTVEEETVPRGPPGKHPHSHLPCHTDNAPTTTVPRAWWTSTHPTSMRNCLWGGSWVDPMGTRETTSTAKHQHQHQHWHDHTTEPDPSATSDCS